MRKILVSQCLYGGEVVRYDGKSRALTDARFLKWKEEGRLIPICPEVVGGLTVPRVDAQRQGNKIITRDGQDVTEEYMAGALKAARLAEKHDVLCAILKEKSPSCGCHVIYDGTFGGGLIEGEGLTAEILRKAGIRTFSEDELSDVELLIEENC